MFRALRQHLIFWDKRKQTPIVQKTDFLYRKVDKKGSGPNKLMLILQQMHEHNGEFLHLRRYVFARKKQRVNWQKNRGLKTQTRPLPGSLATTTGTINFYTDPVLRWFTSRASQNKLAIHANIKINSTENHSAKTRRQWEHRHKLSRCPLVLAL